MVFHRLHSWQALENNDQALLISVLEEDATITTDGGGRVKAALNVVRGSERIAKLLLGIRKKKVGSIVERVMRINGEPGVVTYIDGIPNSLVAFQIDQERVGTIYRILDPIKLKRVPKLPRDSTLEINGRSLSSAQKPSVADPLNRIISGGSDESTQRARSFSNYRVRDATRIAYQG